MYIGLFNTATVICICYSWCCVPIVDFGECSYLTILWNAHMYIDVY